MKVCRGLVGRRFEVKVLLVRIGNWWVFLWVIGILFDLFVFVSMGYYLKIWVFRGRKLFGVSGSEVVVFVGVD